MAEGAFAALIALLIASLPLVLVGLGIAAVCLMILAAIALIALLERPLRYWFLAASVALDVIVLVPLGLASCAVMYTDSGVWREARFPVLVFVMVLVTPTLLLQWYCEKRSGETTDSP